jgi:hypothetical protein
MTTGKVDRREGGHLPSAFAGCHAVGTRQRFSVFFLKKVFAGCHLWHLAN